MSKVSTIQKRVEEKQEDRFVINDDAKADWALEKLRDLKGAKKKKEELAEKRKMMIDSWLEEESSKLDNEIEFFEGLLTEYAMKLKEENKDLKTHSLPFGKLKFRKQNPKWNYDEEKLLRFLKITGIDAIKVKEQIDKQALKNIVKVVGNKAIHPETGEIIEGVEIEEREEKFSIDV
jgi:hypothetical protein